MKTRKSFIITLFWLYLPLLSFAQPLGDFSSYEIKGEQLRVSDGSRCLQIEILSDKTIKVQNMELSLIPFTFSASVVGNEFRAIPEIIESGENLLFYLTDYEVQITKNPIRLKLLNRITKEYDYEEKEGLIVKKDTSILSFKNDPTNVYQGSGARPFGTDFNGLVFGVANTHNGNYYEDFVGFEQSINTPFIVNSNEFGILLDSQIPGKILFDIGGFDTTTVNLRSIGKGQWAYYLFLGSNNDILNEYTNLTGKQAIPPRWVFGVLQSKEGYRGENEILAIQSNYERRGMPLDAIFFDKYWTGSDSTLGNFTFSNVGFPRPKEMLANLESKGIESVIRIDPNIHSLSSRMAFARQFGLLASNETGQVLNVNTREGELFLLDIFKPSTKNFISDKLDELEDLGASAFWINNTEPKIAAQQISFSGTALDDIKGLYGLEWNKTLSNREFHFTSSAYVGSQRFGAIPRSGDPARFWSSFKLQIPIMINAGMSGFGYMHSDIGAFATGSGLADKNEELDLRWLQMSVFSPVLRFHGLRAFTEPYELNDPFLSLASAALKLRYALHPYIYTLAYQNSISGRPLCLPMDYFEKEPYLKKRNDQYFFGEQLIVAPVLLYGMPQRRVDLPSGIWFNFWSNEKHTGLKPIFPKVTLNNIPVYAKAGAIIPMADTGVTSLRNYKSDKLSVAYFQDASQQFSQFTMFEDDGLPGISEYKEFIEFKGESTENKVFFEVSTATNSSPVLSSRSIELVIKNINSIPSKVKIGGNDIHYTFVLSEYESGSQAFYDLKAKELKVKFNWNNKDAIQVEVERDGLAILLAEEKVPQPGFSIIPNPAKSNFLLKIVPYISESFELSIVSILGLEIFKSDLGTLAAKEIFEYPIELTEKNGLFFIKLSGSQSGVKTEKLILIE